MYLLDEKKKCGKKFYDLVIYKVCLNKTISQLQNKINKLVCLKIKISVQLRHYSYL